MKINKWTMGLAAVGLVSLTSVAQAEEAATPLLTALSSTSISGYVDVAAQWNPGTGVVGPGFATAGGKRDGFNVNTVLVTLEKPLEEGEWSAGYRLDLQWGPDVTVGGVTGDADIRQAYVALRVPVGNGLDFKMGRFDTILGYESTDRYKNPNYTYGYAYTLLPTEHTGLLATYQALDWLSLNAGIANTDTTLGINTKSQAFGRAESHKTFMGSLAITAPDDWGFLAGSAFYVGVIDGFGTATDDRTDYYAGATLATPVEGLRFGLTWNFFDDVAGTGTDTYVASVYASFKATEKLGLHLRGEYANDNGGALGAFAGPATVNPGKILAATATVQYDLWENVLSRLEVRWDHAADGSTPYAGKRNDFALMANLVYKF